MQISSPVGPSRSAIEAGVAAAAEGAVDDGLARLWGQHGHQLVGEDGDVLARHVHKVRLGRSAASVRQSAGCRGPSARLRATSSAIAPAASSTSASTLAQRFGSQTSK